MPQGLMLIAYDGSDNAKRAVDYAGRFLSANRAVLVTAWEPMVRQAARMSGLSGVMQPEWVPDDDVEDIAYTDAKVTLAEGVGTGRGRRPDRRRQKRRVPIRDLVCNLRNRRRIGRRHHRDRHPWHYGFAVATAEQRRGSCSASQSSAGVDRPSREVTFAHS